MNLNVLFIYTYIYINKANLQPFNSSLVLQADADGHKPVNGGVWPRDCLMTPPCASPCSSIAVCLRQDALCLTAGQRQRPSSCTSTHFVVFKLLISVIMVIKRIYREKEMNIWSFSFLSVLFVKPKRGVLFLILECCDTNTFMFCWPSRLRECSFNSSAVSNASDEHGGTFYS